MHFIICVTASNLSSLDFAKREYRSFKFLSLLADHSTRSHEEKARDTSRSASHVAATHRERHCPKYIFAHLSERAAKRFFIWFLNILLLRLSMAQDWSVYLNRECQMTLMARRSRKMSRCFSWTCKHQR